MFLSPRIQGSEPTLANCYRVLRRFSVLAAWSVALLAGSGALNTWFMTNGLRNFLGTEYGDLVLIKIVLFVVLLSFGAANRYWFTPQLLPIGATTGENSRSLRLLCTSVAIEITLGLVVICVVAVLGQLPPPRHEHHMD